MTLIQILGARVRSLLLLPFILLPMSPALAASTTLSQLALFHRCYSQITNSRATATDTLTRQVATGQVSAVDACMTVYNSAQLSGSGNMVLSDTSNKRATNVLATFHRLHASWFSSKDFQVISWPGHTGDMMDLYDSTGPALYYTRAAFGSGVRASDPITSPDFLRAIRATAAPTVGPQSGHATTDFVFSTPFSFAGTGTLYGAQTTNSLVLNYSYGGNSGTVNLYSTLGGGFMGTQPYINMNLAPLSSYGTYRTDGGLNLHRRYGKNLFKDVLCRDLPVVRESDALPYVDEASPVSFRTSAACTKCHVSHDRISMVIRGVHMQYIGQGDPSGNGEALRGGAFARYHAVTKGAESSWSSKPDADFFQRPQTGTLYYRDYNGSLVDQPVADVSDLGQKLAAQDDYYLCLTKRYYRYFLGIDVNIGDIVDPDRKTALSGPDLAHRNMVIKLGKTLKQSQSIPQLIRSILSLENYKKSDFGVRNANGT